MFRRTTVTLVALLVGFGSLGSISTSAVAAPSPAAYDLSTRLTAAMARCWFGPNATDFSGYVYTSEPNAAGGPRILVVPRNAPNGLPALVIEITSPGGKPHVSVYGPLAATYQARIAADLRRWMGGSDSCT